MTISYGGSFLRILFQWKGSVWKTVWKELTIWLILYYTVRLIFQFVVRDLKIVSEIVSVFSDFVGELPIEFMLGFYVAQVINRWWSQVLLVPWPDDLMSLVNASLNGTDTGTRARRHAIARYLVLCQILALRKVSIRVRKRFPTIDHVVNAGLMTKNEKEVYNNTICEHVRWQLPLAWAQNIIVPLVGLESHTIAPVAACGIYLELNKYRASLRNVLTYDWICIPLVYTQAAGVGLYGYFAMCLVGRQFFGKNVDAYVPILTILKFIFYVGWFKVAQDLMRPFGEDDDDVELNYLIDRHLQVALSMADQVAEQTIDAQADRFVGLKLITLPHTKLSSMVNDHPPTSHESIPDVKDKDLLEFTSVDDIPILKDAKKKPKPNTKELLQY